MFLIPLHDLLISDLSLAMKDLISKVGSADALGKYLRELNTYPIKVAQPGDPPDVAASDSSRVIRRLSIATLYAVQAVSLKASLKNPSTSKLIVDSLAGYYMLTDEAVPDELLDRIIQLISKVLEVRSVTKVLDECDIALFDGSLISFLWGYSNRDIPRGFYPATYKKIRDIWYEVFSGITKVSKNVKPLFISKRLMRNYYVDEILSNEAPKKVRDSVNDLILISALRRVGKLPKVPYILHPVYVERSKLPQPLAELDIDISPLTPITVTYVSFNPTLQPYQVSIPGRLGIDELVDIISSIYPYSQGGYPDPLKIAHSKCKLSNVEFRLMLYKLGLSSIPTGRELLGEFL